MLQNYINNLRLRWFFYLTRPKEQMEHFGNPSVHEKTIFELLLKEQCVQLWTGCSCIRVTLSAPSLNKVTIFWVAKHQGTSCSQVEQVSIFLGRSYNMQLLIILTEVVKLKIRRLIAVQYFKALLILPSHRFQKPSW